MKKVLAAIIAGLIMWDIWLTYLLNQQTTEQSTDGITYIENTINGYTTDITETVASTYPTLVTILEESRTTTGMIYRQDGDTVYIITPVGSKDEESEVYVRFDNAFTLQAEIVGMDALTDVCVLAVHPEFDVPTVTFTMSDLVKDGEYAIGISSQRPESHYLSYGIITSSSQMERVVEEDSWLFQVFTLERNYTSSAEGALMMNMSGEVLGMITSRLSTANSNILTAVSGNEIISVADALINQDLHRVYLGVNGMNVSEMSVYQKSIRNLSLELDTGVYISELSENGMAMSYGLLAGDVIVSINGQEINTIEELRLFMYEATAETEATFHIIRNNTEIELLVIL